MLPKVKKRDGTEEKFSLINLAKVAVASGLTPEQARQIAQIIAQWSESLKTPTITSLQIRDKMMEELPKMSENAAELYKWYEQSKEIV